MSESRKIKWKRSMRKSSVNLISLKRSLNKNNRVIQL
jgi:hypothetical protein